MMWSIAFSMIKMIVDILKYPLYALLILIALFSFLISVNVVICLAKGKRFKKGVHNIVKKTRFFKACFY